MTSFVGRLDASATPARIVVPAGPAESAPPPAPPPISTPVTTAPPLPSAGAAPPRPTRSARRKRPILLAAAAVALVALTWFILVPWYRGPTVVGSRVLRADLVQTLVASGHIETPFRVSVESQVTGVVIRIPVAEGGRVRIGDTLLVLDATETRALTVQAQGQQAQAAARLRQLRELTLPSAEQALAEANATLLSVQQTYDRNLTALGLESPAALNEAQRALDVARLRVRSAELQVFTNRPGGSDYTLAQTQLAQATASLAAARSRQDYRVVVSPRAGVLISRSVEVGEVVQPGRELMLLAPIGDVDIVVQIDEKNLSLVAPGQRALASADAYPAQRFPAEVIFVNPAVDLQRASVEVKLRVAEPPTYLRQDMTISVDIESARHPRVLLLPTADIHDLGGNRPWVLVANGRRAQQQFVQVGVVSAGRAELLSGVAEGALVVPGTAPTISDGDRVRLVAPAAELP